MRPRPQHAHTCPPPHPLTPLTLCLSVWLCSCSADWSHDRSDLVGRRRQIPSCVVFGQLGDRCCRRTHTRTHSHFLGGVARGVSLHWAHCFPRRRRGGKSELLVWGTTRWICVVDVQPEECVIGSHWSTHTHTHTAGRSSGHPDLKIPCLLEFDSPSKLLTRQQNPKQKVCSQMSLPFALTLGRGQFRVRICLQLFQLLAVYSVFFFFSSFLLFPASRFLLPSDSAVGRAAKAPFWSEAPSEEGVGVVWGAGSGGWQSKYQSRLGGGVTRLLTSLDDV